ncbi:MAG: hypothetical protein R3F22_11750 [Lysobacteraceae bacterium]
MTRHPVPKAAFWLLLSCCLMLLARPAAADTVSIGASGCNYIGFQFMLDELASRPGPHTIKLRTQSFAIPDGITLNTANQNYTFIGGHTNCSDAAPTPGQYSTLDATGGNDGTVFAINGTSSSVTPQITLRGLIIRGGNAETGPFANPEGGGLEVRGRIFVQLTGGTSVEDNASGKGGGVYLRGDNSSETAVLQLLGDSYIGTNSTTGEGGGIYCDDHGTIFLDDGQVSSNQAGENGGGIALRNQCAIDAIIPSNGFAGLLYNHADESGGGIYQNGRGVVSLSGKPTIPFLIYGNTAAYAGAVSLHNPDSQRVGASFRSTVIMDNEADSSAAISILGGVDLIVEPASGSKVCSYLGVSHGACSAIMGNTLAGANPAIGGVITLGPAYGPGFSRDPWLLMRRTLVSGNTAHYVISSVNEEDASKTLDIENSLFVGNHLLDTGLTNVRPSIISLFPDAGDATVRLRYTTMSGNTSNSDQARLLHYGQRPADFTGLLLYNPGFYARTQLSNPTVTHNGCMLTHDNAFASAVLGYDEVLDPPQLDANLMPAATSPALDICSGSGAPAVDFHGNPRLLDQASVSNLWGPGDIGALERPQDGVTGTALFADGFE